MSYAKAEICNGDHIALAQSALVFKAAGGWSKRQSSILTG
jgi:hypothetical protein